jgi:hypothetical protein
VTQSGAAVTAAAVAPGNSILGGFMKLQKLGGYASIVLACLNIAMVGILVNLFSEIAGSDVYDPAKMMDIYHASTVSFWIYYVLSIFTGIFTLLVAVALQERMQATAPNLMRLGVIAVSIFFAFALSAEMSGIYRNTIVAQTNDPSSFRVFLVLHEYLYFAGISALGWGFLLIGCAALRTGALPKMLGYMILIYGIFSISQFAFSISQIAIGLGIWFLAGLITFVWLGLTLLRNEQPRPAR